MELTENDIFQLEATLNRVLSMCDTDYQTLIDFCVGGETFCEEDIEYVGQFGELQFMDQIVGGCREYQVLHADEKLWIFWGDDPKLDGYIWALPIWKYM